MHRTRDRHLTPEEGERYQRIREAELADKAETVREFQPLVQQCRDLGQCVSALKDARVAKGLTRQQVAELASLEPAMIEAIEELRDLNPPIKVLTQYASAVGQHLTLVLSAS